MSFRVENQRVSALHSELKLVSDEDQREIANMVLYYKRDRNELQIKGFKSGFATDFLRTSGKTPAEALFEHAVQSFGTTQSELVIKGNLEGMLTPRDLNHYQRIGMLQFTEDGVWIARARGTAPTETKE